MAKISVHAIQEKYNALRNLFDERTRRLWAAAEACSLPYGGISVVASVTGLSRTTILSGISELRNPELHLVPTASSRIRRPGGGRKSLTDNDVTLGHDLESLVEPLTRGDPESPLRWTCKSTRKLAEELNKHGHRIGDRKVADLLHGLQYSLQANAKTREGSSHPDRNAQFEYINTLAKAFQNRKQPVISVDTKKKELVGNFKNNGVEWRPKSRPEEVQVHDFEDKDLGKVIPYRVYDIIKNEGWVIVGTDHDTSESKLPPRLNISFSSLSESSVIHCLPVETVSSASSLFAFIISSIFSSNVPTPDYVNKEFPHFFVLCKDNGLRPPPAV